MHLLGLGLGPAEDGQARETWSSEARARLVGQATSGNIGLLGDSSGLIETIILIFVSGVEIGKVTLSKSGTV